VTLTSGPLAWPYIPACTAVSLGITTDQYTQASVNAAEWMWSHSARRYGTRTTVYRPQSRERGYAAPWAGLQPVGGWTGIQPDTVEHDQVLELPPPAASITTVTVNGTAVDPTLWRQEGNWLVRQDGGFWPRTQNMLAALGSADTWAVTYERGLAVSPWGQYATGLLICYFARQLSAGRPCVMPYNTTSVTRAGVTIQRDKATADKTSPVPEVDQWLAQVNPHGLAQAPAVWSPDTDRNRWPFSGSYTATQAPQGMSIGDVTQLADFLVLTPGQTVPEGTPVGTVILRTQ